MQQIKNFYLEDDLNEWLEEYSTEYRIIDIKFQFSEYKLKFMVWYEIPLGGTKWLFLFVQWKVA